MAEAKIRITAVDDATRVINRVSSGLQGLAAPLGALGGLSAAAGITAIVAGLRDMVSALDDLDEAAQGLGVTAKELAELRAAAQQSGAGAEVLDKALTQLNVKIQQAAGGNKDAIAAFKALGVAFEEAGKARSTLAVFEDFADKFARFEADSGRAAFAADFFGVKIGPRLAAYLAQGRDGLRLNIGVTDELVEKATRAQRRIDELGNSLQRLRNSVADSDAVEWLTDYISNIAKLAESGRFWEIYWKGGIKAVRDFKQELEDEKFQQFMRNLQDPNFLKKQSLDNLLPKIQAPNLEAEKRAREASEKALKEAAEAANDYKKAGLKSYLDEEAAAARRATAVVAEYNKTLDEGVQIREEWRRTGLEENRKREDQDAARARAQLDQFNKELEESQRIGEELGLVFESAFSQLSTGGFQNFGKALVADITQVIYKMLILEPIIKRIKEALSSATKGGGFSMATLFEGIFGGAKAMGGPVSAGTGYLVGEQGPEFFVPSVSGTIVPNGAMGGVSIMQNISVNGNASPSQMRMIMEASKAETLREVQQQLARRGALSRV